MKILLITDYFPPEIGSASHLFYELGKELVKFGDKVSVITGFPRYNINKKDIPEKYRNKFLMKEEKDGIEVYRIKRLNLSRENNVLRGIEQFITAAIYFFRGLIGIDYDYILVYSPPLPLGLTAYFLKLFKGKKIVFNVQDLFPQSAIDLGALRNEFLIKVLEGIEKFIYKKSDYITVHSEGNLRHVSFKLNNNKSINTIKVMTNWVNTDEIKPGDKVNFFSKKYELEDKFVVSFAGVLGHSQDLDVIIDAAEILKDYKDIIFLIVGDGVVKKKIEKRIVELGLDNVKMLPMQPKEVYPYILHSSDIGLVTLKSNVKTPVVPSKLLSIMAAGIPVLAALPLDGDAPKIIKESKCGICISPENPQLFAQELIKMYEDEQLRKEMGNRGREYVVGHYSLESCAKRYRDIFKQI